MSSKRIFGWAIYRLEPWRLRGPFSTHQEAIAARDAEQLQGCTVRYGEFGVGNDGFLGRDEP